MDGGDEKKKTSKMSTERKRRVKQQLKAMIRDVNVQQKASVFETGKDYESNE